MPQPMWKCPECGRKFANRNQSHTCGLRNLEFHLAGKSEDVVAAFNKLRGMVETCGPVEVLAEKTRIAFQGRISFLGVVLRKNRMDVSFLLARRLESRRFSKVTTYSPRNHGHTLRVTCVRDLDTEVGAWVREAYAVGQQHHLAEG